MTMYLKIDSIKEGKKIESFFNSDIVRFIFLITQYSVPPNTKNEPLVANSITIPPEGIEDYYKFFGIEEHKKYIEDTLSHYELFKQPKQNKKVEDKEVSTTLKPRKIQKNTKQYTKKKTPPKKTDKPGPTIKISRAKLRKVGGKKTKKQRHVKIPRKTRRKL